MEQITYSDDARQYLQMMQENISRMAGNSSNCKSWLVTIVAGMLAISCGIETLNGWIVLAVLPTLAFWYLDVFYLHLERKMRNRELDFILKAKAMGAEANEATISLYNVALYNFAPLNKESLSDEEKAQGFVLTNDRWMSESVKPFYLCVSGAIVLITVILNWNSISSHWQLFFK